VTDSSVCLCSVSALTLVRITVTPAVRRRGPYFVPAVPVGLAPEHEPPYSRIILNLSALTRDTDPSLDRGPFRYRQPSHDHLFHVRPVVHVSHAQPSFSSSGL